MKNKTTLILSAFISAFLITIGIGTISVVSAKNKQTALIQQQTAVSEQQAALSAQVTPFTDTQPIQQVSTDQSIDPTSEPYLVSAQDASDIALKTTGLEPASTPELVSLNGTPAYEVVYDSGKVYVDANSGDVLYNGIPKAPVTITAEQALAVATNYLPGSQPIAMGQTNYNGSAVYVVAFSDGQSVYVDQTGNVVAVQMASTTQNNTQNSYEEHEHDNEGSEYEND